MGKQDQWMITLQEPRLRNTSVEKSSETVKEIYEYSHTLVVSEDLVKTYVGHLKHLEFFQSLMFNPNLPGLFWSSWASPPPLHKSESIDAIVVKLGG